MGQIRGNTRKGIPCCDKDIGRVGRGRKRCECKEEERTEREEKHDMTTVHSAIRGPDQRPWLDMTTSTSPTSDQRRPAKESIDVSILREIARNSLVHALNSVSLVPSP